MHRLIFMISVLFCRNLRWKSTFRPRLDHRTEVVSPNGVQVEQLFCAISPAEVYEEFTQKSFEHLQKQGKDTQRFRADSLDEMAVDFEDDAEGYQVSIEHFCKEDTDGFDSCKNLLAAACHRD